MTVAEVHGFRLFPFNRRNAASHLRKVAFEASSGLPRYRLVIRPPILRRKLVVNAFK